MPDRLEVFEKCFYVDDKTITNNVHESLLLLRVIDNDFASNRVIEILLNLYTLAFELVEFCVSIHWRLPVDVAEVVSVVVSAVATQQVVRVHQGLEPVAPLVVPAVLPVLHHEGYKSRQTAHESAPVRSQ